MTPGAKQRLADAGIALHAVLTLDQIADILKAAGRISKRTRMLQADELSSTDPCDQLS